MEILLRLTLINRLPALLAELAQAPGHRAAADQMVAEARDAAVLLTRPLAAGAPVPRAGDLVVANANFDAVPVTDVTWSLDDGRVLVELAPLDEDQVGPDALGLLIGSGWQLSSDGT
jgi:hypothetical protein